MTWIESRLFDFSFVLRGSSFLVFFCDSVGRKVWPFSGPTGSVTADQISTGRVRFLASVSGTTCPFFFPVPAKEPRSSFSQARNVGYAF